MRFPVIILMDNDTALSTKTCQALNKKFGVSISHSATDLFFHLTDNLYLVKTPAVPEKLMSCIEDFFDPVTKSRPIGGKMFRAEDDGFDKNHHFGKVIFAHKVVAPNAAKIPWGNFSPLLDRIVAVMIDYASKLAPPM